MALAGTCVLASASVGSQLGAGAVNVLGGASHTGSLSRLALDRANFTIMPPGSRGEALGTGLPLGDVGQQQAGAHGYRHARDHASAHLASARRPSQPEPPGQPYLIYDSVKPAALRGHRVIATYANGRYAASPKQVAGSKRVLWIDVAGTDPNASVLDVEPGDAKPAGAARWARRRLGDHPGAVARIYTMRSEWPAARAAIATLPGWMHSHIRWWIADPTGVRHLLRGSDATQWLWAHKYDISVATRHF